ncbi:MAG: HAD hydrolase-like protein [Gammaproteobacteria bacterium]
MNRIKFTILQARLQKPCLKQYLEPLFQCQQLTDLTPERLASFGVKLIALDFDGVLAAHGEVEIRSEVRVWMEAVGLPMVILSNKPNRPRIEHLKKQFPAVEFMQGFRKKPYPDGLLSLMRTHQLRPEQVLMVDDRLLTGLLGACIAGCRGVIVLAPYRRMLQRPVVELFFECLRRIERLWLRWC